MSGDDWPDAPEDFADFDATLSLTNPLEDYKKLMEEKMSVDAFYVPDEMKEQIWDKIDAGARDAVWKLLFEQSNGDDAASIEIQKEEQLDKAAKLLKEHKSNSVYYSPFYYNDWISGLRDELLKREMFEFWKNVIVAKELGPAWAGDSDFYDDMWDPAPAAFYNCAGCVAPWLEKGN